MSKKPKLIKFVPIILLANLGSNIDVLPLYTNIIGSTATAGRKSLYLHLKLSISSANPSSAIKQKESSAESYLMI